MNYLILHYFFMAYICNRRIAGASSRRASNSAIDDFINQLLASSKFDELAEKVADKAVKKIRNMEGGDSIVEKVLSNKNLNDDEGPQHRYQEKIRNFEEKGITFKEREQRSSNNVDNIKAGRINTDALMKKEDDSGQSDSLTLKYKYLKQHAMEKKTPTQNVEHHNVEHAASDEHHPPWRNVENSEEKEKQKRPLIAEREQEPIQTHPLKQDSTEKDDDKDYERNVNSERISNYNKKAEIPNNNYEKEHDRYNKGSDNDNYKNRFFDEHEREQRDHRDESDVRENRSPNINERGREESISPDKQDIEENSKPQFKSEHLPLREINYDSPPILIDLDDNENRPTKHITTEEPKNVYKEIVDQQKTGKSEYQNDAADEEDTTNRDAENVFAEDHKMLAEDAASDEDDTYKRSSENENGVTSGNGQNEYTTRKRLIRREGNRFYTYLSAPEYAEYHEELAKQSNNEKKQFDIK